MLLRILSLSPYLSLSFTFWLYKTKTPSSVRVCVYVWKREREYLNIFDTTFENVCVNRLKGQCSLQRCQRWRSVLSRPQRVVPFTASTSDKTTRGLKCEKGDHQQQWRQEGVVKWARGDQLETRGSRAEWPITSRSSQRDVTRYTLRETWSVPRISLHFF